MHSWVFLDPWNIQKDYVDQLRDRHQISFLILSKFKEISLYSP